MCELTEDRLSEGADAVLDALTEYETGEMDAIMCLALASFVRGMHSFSEANGGSPQTLEKDIRAIMLLAEGAIGLLKETDNLPTFKQ